MLKLEVSAFHPLRTFAPTAKLGTMKWVPCLAALLSAVTFTPTAAHAYCVGDDQTHPAVPYYYSVPKEFGRANFVIEGVVTNEEWIGDNGKPRRLSPPFNFHNRPSGIAAPYIGAWYDVQVTRTFKGRPPLRLRLFSENSTARFWLNKGERYLLFVTEEVFDPPVRHALTVDTCGNSAKTNHTLLRKIRALAPRG
jgi:hypothetical protein